MNRTGTATTKRGKIKRWLPTFLTLAVAIPACAQTTRAVEDGRIRRVVLVSLLDRKLAVLENGRVVASFRVGVGAAVSPSPEGEFEIVSRVTNPTYYHEGVVIPAGKDSPIGTRWIGLSEKGYGIHGTNAPRSIGQASSHGCIRLRNRDMERLFTMLRAGDLVQIRGERDEEVARVFGGDAEDATVAAAQTETLAENGGQ
jgi:lipoprotein-anchoring transpeptidase ErfK/SrfK